MSGFSNTQDYPQSSPYYDTNVVNNKFLDFLEYREIPINSNDVYYEVPLVYQYRPDLLAYDLYGDPALYWVFAARNPNKLGPDPYFNLVAGVGIYIPTLITLQLALGI
jgi:Base plate wedge protein 53